MGGVAMREASLGGKFSMKSKESNPSRSLFSMSLMVESLFQTMAPEVLLAGKGRREGKAQTEQSFLAAKLTLTAASMRSTFVPPWHIWNAPWF